MRELAIGRVRGRPALAVSAGCIAMAVLVAAPASVAVPLPSGSGPSGSFRARTGACSAVLSDRLLTTRIARTRALALSRLRAAATGRTDRFPHSAGPAATRWTRRSASAWTAGFYPASLWQAYEWTRDPAWLKRARTWTAGVRPQATNTGTHDLGFVIDTTAGRGVRVDPSSAARTSYARTVLTAARSLSTRWNARVGAVQSGTYDGRWGVIVDSVMNMELLFHAARLTKDPAEASRFRGIGHQHLLTVAQTFVRADGSTFHRMSFDPVTGVPQGAVRGQGHRESSTWSRGQAWAVYGFTAGYRQTRDPRLLSAARQVAGFWITRSSSDCVPRWDFAAPAELPQKDSSAAAIAAAGLFELARLDPDPAARSAYRSHALATLARLMSTSYTTAGTAHPAVLRRASYSIPAHPREGSYIWGDHYLLEAMSKALRTLR